MICPSCKIAGQLTSIIRNDPDNHTHAERIMYRNALGLHGQCRGGTWCDCAHIVPEPTVRVSGY